jgi:hypothetical protein
MPWACQSSVTAMANPQVAGSQESTYLAPADHGFAPFSNTRQQGQMAAVVDICEALDERLGGLG